MPADIPLPRLSHCTRLAVVHFQAGCRDVSGRRRTPFAQPPNGIASLRVPDGAEPVGVGLVVVAGDVPADVVGVAVLPLASVCCLSPSVSLSRRRRRPPSPPPSVGWTTTAATATAVCRLLAVDTVCSSPSPSAASPGPFGPAGVSCSGRPPGLRPIAAAPARRTQKITVRRKFTPWTRSTSDSSSSAKAARSFIFLRHLPLTSTLLAGAT